MILHYETNHPDYRTAYVRIYPDGGSAVTHFDHTHRHNLAYGDRVLYSTEVPERTDAYYIIVDPMDGRGASDTLGVTVDNGSYSDDMFLVGSRLYYPSTAQDYLRYFDLRTGVNGRLIMDSEYAVEPETFRSLTQVGDLIYGMIRHKRLGYEPFYIDGASGRLVAGTAYHDDNKNQQQDTGEEPIAGYSVRLTSSQGTMVASTDQAGRYSFLAKEDTGPLTLEVEEPGCGGEGGFTPDAYTIVGTEDVTGRDFAFRSARNRQQAASVHFILGNTRCNTTTPLWINVTNDGCSPLTNGYLRLDLPTEMYVVPTNANSEPSASGSYEFAIDSLRPLASMRLELAVRLPSENYTGYALPITLTALAGVDTLGSYEDAPILRCAYDPNDKQVHPLYQDPGDHHYAARGERLSYTIRFQNTGNDTAYSVRLVDQLSESLNWTTYHLESSSHPCTSAIDEFGKLTFQFDQIMLPDSATDLTASQGYVRFSLLPNAEGPSSERVENTAEIYFDANQPIITNSVHNTIVPYIDQDKDTYPFWVDCDDTDPQIYPGAAGTAGHRGDENCDGISNATKFGTVQATLRYFPNPVSEVLHIEVEGIGTSSYQAQVYTVQGQLVRETTFTNEGAVTVGLLPSGAYLVRVTSAIGGTTSTFWINKQ